ncbi:MAG: SEL1-like repeat protein [Faecousia sp.]
MNIVTMEDINYFAQQSSGRLNMILSGMTALMRDTDEKVAVMESQGWFQRMVKTVFGKNKMTQSEIQQNHDKLNAYMSEAIAELYNRNCIDHKVMLSLGMQLNELYADHLQLKQMLGAFVSKLNEKIDSVDNFHMLTTEIAQGVYSEKAAILSICDVLSQFDNRIIEDKRKLDIIKRALLAQNVINDTEVPLTDYLYSITEIPMEEAGKIYLELSTIRGNFISNIILNMMEAYHFLPDMARKMKNKNALIAEVIEKEGLDSTISLTANEIYDDFINSKIDVKNGLMPIADIQIDLKIKEAEQLYFECKLDEAYDLFKTLAAKSNARAMYFLGKYYTEQYGHVAMDAKEGEKWFQRGYELGDTLAGLQFAGSLDDDNLAKKTFGLLFDAALQLAESGDVFAQFELAGLYANGYGVEKNAEECIKWLEKSADAGFWGSMNEIGENYYYGIGVAEDNDKAVQWYSMGAEKGFSWSVFNLGYCYYRGFGVAESNEKALELFRKSYSLGCGKAAYFIGVMYNHGYGVSVDHEQESLWMKKSADLGCYEGYRGVGNCYYYGNGTAQNKELAVQYYKKASEGEDDYSTTQLGIIAVDNQDYSKAIIYFKIAAENEYSDAQNRLGCIYEDGKGISQDKAEAFKWFLKAAKQGHKKAQANVGRYYHEGIIVEQNDDVAKEWLKKSSEQGWETADALLYEYYGEGDSPAIQSPTGTISQDTYKTIKTKCNLFLFGHDRSKYDPTYKLKSTLGILYEDVYLAHDDTLFKSGKNGFAITENGVYCRGFMESDVSFTSFEELAEADCIFVHGSDIFADGKQIAYFTGSDEEKNDLKNLFESIKLFVSVDLW